MNQVSCHQRDEARNCGHGLYQSDVSDASNAKQGWSFFVLPQTLSVSAVSVPQIPENLALADLILCRRACHLLTHGLVEQCKYPCSQTLKEGAVIRNKLYDWSLQLHMVVAGEMQNQPLPWTISWARPYPAALATCTSPT